MLIKSRAIDRLLRENPNLSERRFGLPDIGTRNDGDKFNPTVQNIADAIDFYGYQIRDENITTIPDIDLGGGNPLNYKPFPLAIEEMKKSKLRVTIGLLVSLLVLSTGCDKKEDEITSYDKDDNTIISDKESNEQESQESNSNYVSESNSNDTTKSNGTVTTQDSELTSFNATTATKKINDVFDILFSWYWTGNEYGKNIFAEAKKRNAVVEYMVSKQAKKTNEDDGVQEFYYVDYATFNQQHQLAFESNYKTSVDIVKDKDLVNIIGSNKVMWLYSGIPSDCKLTATKISYDSGSKCYVISGTFSIEEDPLTGKIATGTFKLSYNKTNQTRTLKSFVLTKSK